jgi:demethylmenaquinone methyltransferase/2-methoxy-6-polyprenyl-1,4-benzoquinol methylase
VATGTGDFAFEALSLHPDKIIGVDISEGMLKIAQEKIDKRKESHRFEVRLGDSEKLLFEDNTFDAVTVSFGVRNFENLDKGLSDINRVLRNGGKLVVLEFSNPKKFPIKQLYNFYSFKILPLFGKLFSSDARAYTYLPESVKAFPDGEDFLLRMKNVGFKESKCISLGFGSCSIYTGIK